MKTFYGAAAALVVMVAFAATLAFGGSSSPTPTHVAATYADAINHGDSRLACQQIQPAVKRHLWGGQSGCESYFTAAFGQVAQLAGLGGYKVVAHSVRQWREGDVRVARVLVVPPYGDVLRVRLVKTAHGWRLASIGS